MEKKLDFPLLLLSFASLILLHSQTARCQNSTTPVNVGVVLDMDTWVGQMGLSCITLALSDFYDSHGFYKTRVVPKIRDSKEDVVEAAAAALDLMKNVQVQAIIGPVSSTQADFIIDLGGKAQVPIISFSATSPSLSLSRSRYFIRATQSDSSQVKVISSIVKNYGWRKVVPIYVDNMFGEGFIPFLADALEEVNTHISYRSVIPPLATDDYILKELSKLMTMQTRIFIVHLPPNLGSLLFTKAKEIGMLSEEYAWIITDSLTNWLNSFDPSVIDSMQGVIGVKPRVPQTEELQSFTRRWKLKFQENNPRILNHQLNVFGLWAYDSATALAMAVEKAGVSNQGFQKSNVSRNSTDLDTIEVSSNGPTLLQEIWNTKFKGLSGDFEVVNGQLQSPAYQIVNVVGTRAKEVGFWNVENGLLRQQNVRNKNTYSAAKVHLGTIIWPGFTTTHPKGWTIPNNGKALRVLVPVKYGFEEFIKVSIDASTNEFEVTGYCINMFNAVVASLPNAPHPEYIPFSTSDGKHPAGTYNDLVYQIYLGNYDAAVGDITIITNRTRYVEFSLPFSDSGFSMVVPNKDNKSKYAWLFVKPLTWDLWLTSFLFFILIGILIWTFEHRINEEFRGPPSHQVGTLFWFAFSTLVFANKEKIKSNLARFVLIIWFLVVLILTQAYTASLTSMLTVQQLQPTINSIDDLVKSNVKVGYQYGSFVYDFLQKKGIGISRLVSYGSVEELNQLFTSKGSGRIAAAVDEIPYIQVFLAKYCSNYTMVQATCETDGFGFAFPPGSPLVTDVSQAVLDVTQNGKIMKKIESPFTKSCPDNSTSLTSNNLSMESFWGLFLIVGVAAGLAFFIYLVLFLQEHQNIVNNSQLSLREKIEDLAQCFDNKDVRFHTFRNIELQVETRRDPDGSQRIKIVLPDLNPAGSPVSLSLQVPPTPTSSSPNQGQRTSSREDTSDQPLTSPNPTSAGHSQEPAPACTSNSYPGDEGTYSRNSSTQYQSESEEITRADIELTKKGKEVATS